MNVSEVTLSARSIRDTSRKEVEYVFEIVASNGAKEHSSPIAAKDRRQL